MNPPAEAKWGIVSTILAPSEDILRFCAYHLQAGAHRLYIYLDDPEAEVFETLKAHRRIRPTLCTPGYWKKQGGARPVKHQVRQTKNATRAYRRKDEVDWMSFWFPNSPLARCLARLAQRCSAHAPARWKCWREIRPRSKPSCPNHPNATRPCDGSTRPMGTS